jgi:hypothetical protein
MTMSMSKIITITIAHHHRRKDTKHHWTESSDHRRHHRHYYHHHPYYQSQHHFIMKFQYYPIMNCHFWLYQPYHNLLLLQLLLHRRLHYYQEVLYLLIVVILFHFILTNYHDHPCIRTTENKIEWILPARGIVIVNKRTLLYIEDHVMKLFFHPYERTIIIIIIIICVINCQSMCPLHHQQKLKIYIHHKVHQQHLSPHENEMNMK